MSQKTVRNLGLWSLTLLIAGMSIVSIWHAARLDDHLRESQERRDQFYYVDQLLVTFVDISADLDKFVNEEQVNIKPLLMLVKDLLTQATEGQANFTHPPDQEKMADFLIKLKEYRVAMLAYSRELAIRRTGEGIRTWKATLGAIETEAHGLIQGIKLNLRSEIDSYDQLLLRESTKSRRISMLLGCGGILGALVIGIWLRIAMAKPINRLVEVCEMVAEGDLQQEIKHFDEDEIGNLARSVQSMIGSLRNVVSEIKGCAGEIVNVSAALGRNVREIEGGAALQGDEIDKVSTAVGRMDTIITNLNGKVNHLMLSLDDSSSSGRLMSLAIWKDSELADGLADEVECISSAQLEMHRSITEGVTFLDGLLESSQQVTRIAEGLASTSEQVGQVAHKSKTLTENVTQMAEDKGAAALAETVTVTRENKQLVDDYSKLISSLGQRSAGIGNVTSVVSNVADQINLLALNAAIIAAQAGEHGRGFAVVAQEIRNLSNETSASIQEIEEGINGVQQEVEAAVTLIAQVMQGADTCIESALQADDILKEIVSNSVDSSAIARQIATAAQLQLEHSREIRQKAAETTDQVMQTKIMLAEQKSASNNIVSSVEALRDISGQLKLSAKEQAGQAEVISEALQSTHEFSREIAAAMDGEQEISKDIVAAMDKIATVASNNRRIVDTLSGSVDGLGALSEKLTPEVDKFKLPQSKVATSGGGDIETG